MYHKVATDNLYKKIAKLKYGILLGKGSPPHMCNYSETSNDELSEKQTISVQRTNSMPPIILPIEIVYLEPPRSGHLSTPDNGQLACPQRTATYRK